MFDRWRTGATTLTLLAALLLAACGGGSSNPDSAHYQWEQVLPMGNGAFPQCWTQKPNEPDPDCPAVLEPGKFPLGLRPVIGFDGDLWMMWQRSSWSSPDGLTWTKHDKADWGERIYVAYAYFDNRLWMFGGMSYSSRNFQNDIWSSVDGKIWTQVANGEWQPRGEHTVIAFRDRLWLFGGATGSLPDRSTADFLNDVWSSGDGIHWVQETAAAPWSPRDHPKVLEFKDELYMLGGQGVADVWRSTNGKDWTQVTSAPAWGSRHDYAALVFDDKLWVYGGWTGVSPNALNDVWYSSDGVTWSRQTASAPWGVRSPITIVFKNKLWIFSGKHTGGTDSWGGDIWTMSAAK